MTDPHEVLKARIRERLAATNKSAAAASIEAGLGKSAIQDILAGNSVSPRMNTLYKLAGPLGCSFSYLAGALNEEPRLPREVRDVRTERIYETLEAGVFRANRPFGSPNLAVSDPQRPSEYPIADDPRLPGYIGRLYRLSDRSLTEAGIMPGDILHCFENHGGKIELKQGQLVIVEYHLSPNNNLIERTARFVEIIDDGFRLSFKSLDPLHEDYSIDPIPMGEEDSNSYTLGDGWLTIDGVVGAVFREMPVVA